MKPLQIAAPLLALFVAAAAHAGSSGSGEFGSSIGQAALAGRLGYYEGGFAVPPVIPGPKIELPRYELIELARLNTEVARLEQLDGGTLSADHQARMQRLFDQFCANHPDVTLCPLAPE